MPTAQENLAAIAAMLKQAGLGPVTVTAPPMPGFPDGVVTVELPAGPDVARRLVRWLDFLDVLDAIAGKYHDTDTVQRLILRGLTPSGAPLLVIGEFNETTDPAAAELIRDQIEEQDIPGLLADLVAHENRVGQVERCG
ncbi:hypothetical protein [Amycolatopsis sp. CA-126428]|uniref:hypothetical protein n=1 Tax=Amycolatopsis sp. CA-126428 TaxID=2073158 RepID=UPI000CD3018A|nr:hypothetical protein [Amycolatopsis sp. CA-126428]